MPLPIEQVAEACGITEFHELTVNRFEGGLIQNEEKTAGYILVKAGSSPERRRFTVAHELGHFLNPYHVAPPGSDQLLCTSQHMRASGTPSDARLGMEAQANEFAANVLMPEQLLRDVPQLWGSPQIQAILDLPALCFVSKEAAARRYLDLHGDPCAVVFSLNGKVRYALSRGGFPYVELAPDQPIPRSSLTAKFTGLPGAVSDQEEADPHTWLALRDAPKWQLWEEMLIQQDGYRMTLLVAEESSYEEDKDLEERWTPKFR